MSATPSRLSSTAVQKWQPITGRSALASVEAGVRAAGVLPVIALSTADDSVPVARALAAGGLAAVEITFRTEAAADAIAAIRAAMPDLLVVAGTVQRTSQVDAAIASGAQLIVTPGFNPVVVDYCLERGLPVMPGVATPSDVEQALLRELRLLALARHGSVPRPGRTSANAANGD